MHLQLTPCILCSPPKKNIHPRVHVHPVHPLATPMTCLEISNVGRSDTTSYMYIARCFALLLQKLVSDSSLTGLIVGRSCAAFCQPSSSAAGNAAARTVTCCGRDLCNAPPPKTTAGPHASTPPVDNLLTTAPGCTSKLPVSLPALQHHRIIGGSIYVYMEPG